MSKQRRFASSGPLPSNVPGGARLLSGLLQSLPSTTAHKEWSDRRDSRRDAGIRERVPQTPAVAREAHGTTHTHGHL